MSREFFFAGTKMRTYDLLTHIFVPRHYHQTGIPISSIDHFAPIGSQYCWDLAKVRKTSTVATGNFTQSLFIQ